MYNEVVRGKVTGIQNFVAIIHEKYLAHTARMAVRLLPLEFTAWGEGIDTRDGNVGRLAQNMVHSLEEQPCDTRYVQNLWVHNTRKKRW